MLSHLVITNLALIQNIEIDLSQGFSVFTGETGAGKSVLMGAIGLLLGNRAASEHIRSGEKQAEVCGTFFFETVAKPIENLLRDNEIPFEERSLIIRRVINRSGRNRILINQVQVPLLTLKKLGNNLIDLHGQHDHQALLHEEAAFTIIDSIKRVKPAKKAYQKVWLQYRKAREALAFQKRKLKELKEKEEFLRFQYEEISKLALEEGEEEKLEQEFTLLSSVTDRALLASKAYSLLDGSEVNIGDNLAQVHGKILALGEMDNRFDRWTDDLAQMREVITDLSATMSTYCDSVQEEANPTRLDDINSRIAKIQRLKKKYYCDFAGIIQKRTTLEEELEIVQSADTSLAQLEQEVEQTFQYVMKMGTELKKARESATQSFDRDITTEMSKLGFSGGGFLTSFEDQEKPTEHGLENLTFMARTNRGEPFNHLAKTASGGEISRIMLAIKSVLAENDPVPILVFDEIDTGVGGTRAADIAKAMVKLAHHHQIFVISHLHQIASVAENHYSVYKKEHKNRTVTLIEKLNKKERIKEIARMLGGDSEVSLRHATELLH